MDVDPTDRSSSSTHSHDVPIADADLSVRARNALLRSGIHTTGQLRELSIEDLLQLPQVGRQTVTELAEFLIRFRRSPGSLRKSTEGSERPDDETLQPHAQPSGIVRAAPQGFSEISTRHLLLRGDVAESLGKYGFATLADIWNAHPEDLARVPGLSLRSARTLVEDVGRLAAIPLHRLRALSAASPDSGFHLPALPPAVLLQLARARTIDEEIRALLSDVEPRNRELILNRWGFYGPAPTLDSLGANIGVARERVRQIVAAAEDRLSRSGVWLPAASAAVRWLSGAGDALPDGVFRQQLHHAGLVADPGVVRVLPCFAAVGIVPEIRYEDEFDLWLTSRGVAEWIESGRLADQIRAIRAAARRELRRLGAIHEDTITPAAPFGAEHALRVAFPTQRDLHLRKVGEHWVVTQRAVPALVRAVQKMLAVTASYPLEEVAAGLRRMVRSARLPTEVLRSVLEDVPGIHVVNEVVWASERPRPEEVLSQSERIMVAAFENHGGALLSNDLEDMLTRSGFSPATAHFAMRSPYLRQPKAGIYVLRGRTIPPGVMRELLHKRRQARRKTVVESRWEGDGVLVVRYRISRFLLNGVLGLPLQLRRQSGTWRARLDGGEEREVTLRNGFLWSLRTWLAQRQARENDQLRVRFYLPESRMEIELLGANTQI